MDEIKLYLVLVFKTISTLYRLALDFNLSCLTSALVKALINKPSGHMQSYSSIHREQQGGFMQMCINSLSWWICLISKYYRHFISITAVLHLQHNLITQICLTSVIQPGILN